eukprot:gene10574-2697_t
MGNKGAKPKNGDVPPNRRTTVSKGTSFNTDGEEWGVDSTLRKSGFHEFPNQTNASIVSYSRVSVDYTEIEPGLPKLEIRTLNTPRKNPWKSIRHQSLRPRKEIIGTLEQLLDDRARNSAWYCLAVDREDAMSLLEDNARALGDGAFVLTASGLNFALLTLLYKGNVLNVPIKNDADGLYIPEVRFRSTSKRAGRCQSFSCLSGLVDALSTGTPKYLPCLLRPHALEQQEYLNILDDVQLPTNVSDQAYDMVFPEYYTAKSPGQYAIANSEKDVQYDDPSKKSTRYDNLTSTPPSLQYANVSRLDISIDSIADKPNTEVLMTVKSHHQYEDVGQKYHQSGYMDPNSALSGKNPSSPQYTTVPNSDITNPGDDGFIRISHLCFTEKGEIKGVSFQPCESSEWFFVGLSNVLDNYHGQKDMHYDDIDFAIFCRGSGKATARECEDEVGPFISYSPGDTFEIRISRERKRMFVIEYLHNGSVFYVSTREPVFPLWVDQAFHPDSLGVEIIKQVQWT